MKQARELVVFAAGRVWHWQCPQHKAPTKGPELSRWMFQSLVYYGSAPVRMRCFPESLLCYIEIAGIYNRDSAIEDRICCCL